MDSTSFNANPTVFATAVPSIRPGRSHAGGAWSELGLIPHDSSDSSEDDEGDEPIDQMEIFGQTIFCALFHELVLMCR